ncbi:TPA: conjugal transfer protein TraF, partial [Streptococcus suis]
MVDRSNVLAEDYVTHQIVTESKISIEDYHSNVKELKKINFSTLKSIFNNSSEQSFTIYFGRPTCYYCRVFSPTLKEFDQLLDGKLLYYDTSSQDFDSVAQRFIFDELGVPGTPTILHVKHGEILNGWVGGGTTAQD